MTIVLFNTAPVVAKLVEKLAVRRGDSLVDAKTLDGRKADVAVVDDSAAETYDAARAGEYGAFTLYMGSRFEPMPEGFDATLPKPFLPEELDKILDDAELSLAARTDRADLFDADEAAALWEAEASAEGGVFDAGELDEVKQLLEAVEAADEDADETTLQARIDEALETLDEAQLQQPVDEVLFEAQKDASGDDEAIDLHARGVEALQDLMAILSDESVAKALKSMGVRIDISFGEKA